MNNIQKSKQILIVKKLKSIGFLTTEKPIIEKLILKKNTIYSVNYPFIHNKKIYSSSGISYNKQGDAQTYAIGEALERYQMLVPKKKSKTVFKKLEKIPAKEFEIYDTNKIDPIIRNNYILTNSSYFIWEEVFDYKNQKEVLLPAQLLYNIFSPKKPEKIIRTSISTGAACGPTHSFALLKGLIEVIERDNFTLYYLTQCPPSIIDVTQNKNLLIKINEISDILNSHVLVLDFSYDFSVYVICVLFIKLDGTLCSIGLGSDFNLINAIEHALLESGKLLTTLENIKANIHNNLKLKETKELQDIMFTNAKRWIIDKPVENLIFLTKGKYIKIDSYKQEMLKGKDMEKKLSFLISELLNKNYNLFIKTADEVVPGFTTIKALIPQLLPLYVTEKLPYKVTVRLKEFMSKKKIKFLKNEKIFPPPFL